LREEFEIREDPKNPSAFTGWSCKEALKPQDKPKKSLEGGGCAGECRFRRRKLLPKNTDEDRA